MTAEGDRPVMEDTMIAILKRAFEFYVKAASNISHPWVIGI